MSILRTNAAQIGQSVTATNNFTLYQPSTPDGTVRLGVGNAGATTADLLTINSSGNLGVGATPSPWTTSVGVKAVQIGSRSAIIGSDSNVNVSFNTYFDGTTVRYIANGTAAYYLINGNEHQWFNISTGTAGADTASAITRPLNINPNGNLALQGGNLTANGVGITFPVTQVSSSNANTLDDYEEGTFSPQIDGWSGTYSAQFGHFTKVGNLVYCFGRATTNGGTGTFTITFPGIANFPFPGGPAGSAAKGMWFATSGTTGLSSSQTASGPLDGPGNGGTAAFPNWIITGGDVTNFNRVNLSAGGTVEIRFFVTYTT
jgi:hypothetical protein